MTYNNDWKSTENNMPDPFHPTPQTPEQVDEGLRNAFRQAIKDGVMDATPYLKQMTPKIETDISKVLIEGEYATVMGVKYKRVEEPKSPVEEEYKDWCGEYPSGTPSEDTRWASFLAGYQTTQPKAVPVEEPTKPMDEVVERLVKKYQARKLWNIVRDKLGFSIDMCDEIVDTVEEWLPKEQSAEGSQSVDTELLVDGFNHCLQKMKGMLR